ncbi:MAG: CotH kinase family protein [Bryobacteraceae bacterium]
MWRIVVIGLVTLLAARLAHADKADTFFDDSKVQEIRLYFDNANWYNTLYQAHSSNPNDPYFSARMAYGDLVLPTIGARFKGNASFRRTGTKKSFKLDFNEFVPGTTFLGLKKLNLNNGDLQPDFLREKLFCDFVGKFIPANRAVHVRVYVNDVYWGLYIAVEEPDKTMMRDRFGDNEDGNLYKAGEANATLAYLGTSAAAYERVYEKKTNETANDWSDLIDFTYVLNNTPTADLPAQLEPICDVRNMLYGIATNILFVNLDSYVGSATEYFLYHRQDTGQFVHIHTDLNETFGTTGDGSPRITVPATLSPLYLPTSSSGGAGSGPSMGGPRPLMEKLWAVDAYKRTYLRMLARMLREGFDVTSMQAQINRLADLIRPDVYADTRKFYTNQQFETSLTSQISGTQNPILGLTQFVRDRYNYLRPVLDGYAQPADVRLNEVVPANAGTYKDSAGDSDPWIELHNLGPGTVNLSGLYLTDDSSNPTKWALPSGGLADGAFRVLWLDGETGEGTDHAGFKLQPGGGALYLYHTSGGQQTLIDSVVYPALAAGKSLIRIGDSGIRWLATDQPTPASANPKTGATPTSGTGQLKINELMADNKKTLADPDEPDAFEDWFEIYNPGSAAVDMGGMYLSDNPEHPTKWRIPRGVTIPAKGFLVFWADNDTDQGLLHTNLNLDADGEEISLYESDGATLIDTVAFKQQQPDVSYGRTTDGTDTWSIFKPATPGAANSLPYANWIVSAASYLPAPLAPEAIAAAFGQDLAPGTALADAVPLPTKLADTTVEVTDSAGVTLPAPLFFVSPGQVNFQIPAGSAAGRARVSIRGQGAMGASGDILIDSLAPGLFSANASGQGIGLMAAVRVDAAGAQTIVPVFQYDSTSQRVVSVPISLGTATDKVYLLLFGTGIRGILDLAAVDVKVDGVSVPVEYAAAQGSFVGLDQVNVGPLPKKLAGRGEVDIVLKVDGRRANTVTVNMR